MYMRIEGGCDRRGCAIDSEGLCCCACAVGGILLIKNQGMGGGGGGRGGGGGGRGPTRGGMEERVECCQGVCGVCVCVGGVLPVLPVSQLQKLR